MDYEALVGRLRKSNRKYNHYITIVGRKVRATGGPLGGMPIPVKDVIYTKGTRTTAASRVLADFFPAYDATVVRKLEEGGGLVIGKTNTHEFAMGPSTTSEAFGTARNPNNPELITGGSSGGSAGTVGAGDVPASIGTDTGGSVRMPAALCGVYGFKPTLGRISRHGVIPISWTMDCVGILAGRMDDLIRVYDVVKGYDPFDPATVMNESVADPATKRVRRIGLIKELSSDNETGPGFDRLVASLSETYEVVEVSIPETLEMSRFRAVILTAEAAAYHARWFARKRHLYGKDVLQSLLNGYKVRASDYVNAQRLREVLAERIRAAFASYDLLLCPTVKILPPAIAKVKGHERKWAYPLTRNTAAFSMAALPAISVPVAKNAGAQFIADVGEDSALLNFARGIPRRAD